MASDLFTKVAVDVPNRSGFDMSHENLFSSKCGTLTPALIDVLLPNDTIDLSAIANVQLPPFASDFFGRIELKLEAFFVPFRLLYGGWKDFITVPLDFVGQTRPETTPNFLRRQVSNVYLPSISVTDGTTDPTNGTLKFADYLGAGSLADYLGYKVDPSTIASGSSVTLSINALPFIAYHKIWDDWYRDARLVSSCFAKPAYSKTSTSTSVVMSPSFMPYANLTATTQSSAQSSLQSQITNFSFGTATQGGLTVSPMLFDLRQRSFGKDYFTNSTPLPQAGNQQSVGFTVNTSTGDGSFSIASLRAANSLQQWLERNNLAGNRYGDQIRANYGIYPADAVTDRCIYLGRVNIPVYAKSVYQTALANTNSTQNNNPFDATVGATYGAPQGVKSGNLCKKFTVSEHGYLFVMASLVPTAYYSTGVSKHFYYKSITDFGWPLLQGTGDQYISKTELVRDPWNMGSQPVTFGYTQRYSSFKFMPDEVHGLMRDGENLESFALQRSFQAQTAGASSAPVISSLFNEIPINFLDQISAVSNNQSSYGYWCDCYFKYYKVSTLAAYSIPTLGELKNVHKETIPLGGSRL